MLPEKSAYGARFATWPKNRYGSSPLHHLPSEHDPRDRALKPSAPTCRLGRRCAGGGVGVAGTSGSLLLALLLQPLPRERFADSFCGELWGRLANDSPEELVDRLVDFSCGAVVADVAPVVVESLRDLVLGVDNDMSYRKRVPVF